MRVNEMRVRSSGATRVAAAVMAAALFSAAGAAHGQELLLNGGFELGELNQPGAPNWITYNTVFTSGEYARAEGGKSLKAYGPFFEVGAGAVGLQAVSATANQAYTLTGFMFSPTADRVNGSNFGILELHFLDASNAVIPGSAVQEQFTAASPADVWVPYTINATAPANAVSAEVVVGHIQINNPFTGGAVFWDDLSLRAAVVSAESVYVGTSGGSWLEPSNWQAGRVPNAVGAVANFNATINAPATVSANAPVTAGTIRLNSPVSYTLGGSGPITLDVASGAAAIQVLAGSHAIGALLVLNDATDVNVAAGQTLTVGGALTLANGARLTANGPGVVRIASPGVTGSAGASLRANGGRIDADVNLGANVDVIADAGEVRFNATQRVRSLAVSGTARATLANVATPTVLRTPSLTLASTATLDLGDNAAVVDYAGASPLAAIRERIIAGRANNGVDPGIVSSRAQADGRFAVGYAEASAVGSPTTFAGETGIDATTVLLRVTLKGDATLDGTVAFPDLVSLAQNYNLMANARWDQGDFTYDAAVTFPDLVALAQNYNGSALGTTELSALGGSDFASDFALAQSLVPEPATLSLVGTVAAVATRRRRR